MWKLPCEFTSGPRGQRGWSICSFSLADTFLLPRRKHITDALVVTNIHKSYMVGEHARCLYKLSQALYQDDGKDLEADMMLQEAESLYFSRSEDQGRTPAEDDYDGLVYLHWR